jgi:hypothetical protein
MKKINIIIMAIFLSLSFQMSALKAESGKVNEPVKLVATNPNDAAKVKVMELRLIEIKEMDKSGLKSAEKRELRNEVRTIKTQLAEMGGGVYISVGAIIIIILLLILLL